MYGGRGQFVIYRILNTVNKHRYYGHTNCANRRENDHFLDLQRGIHTNDHLQNAWNKYGPDAFIFEVMFLCEDREHALELEQQCLDILKPEYNISKTARVPIYERTPEWRANVSDRMRGNTY